MSSSPSPGRAHRAGPGSGRPRPASPRRPGRSNARESPGGRADPARRRAARPPRSGPCSAPSPRRARRRRARSRSPHRRGRRPAGRRPSRCAGGSARAEAPLRAHGTPGTTRSRAGSSCRRAFRRYPGSPPGSTCADALALAGVLALDDLLDQLGAEGRQVVGLARGDEALVDVDLFVDPVAARVLDVGLQRRPRGEGAPAHDVGLDERPRPVADRRHRLALLEERLRERDGILVGAQEVRVGDAARQNERVVLVGLGVGDLAVDVERVALVEVVEALDLAALERDQLGLAALGLDRLPRLGELNLLDALVRHEERDPLDIELAGHLRSPFGFGSSLPGLPGPRRPSNPDRCQAVFANLRCGHSQIRRAECSTGCPPLSGRCANPPPHHRGAFGRLGSLTRQAGSAAPMRPADQTPTEPSDYATLSLAYGSLMAVLAASARDREPIASHELLPLSAATFALSKLIVREKAETWIRRPFVEEAADEARPRGRGLRYAIGELLTCTRCTGAWSALTLVGLRLHAPRTGRTVTAVLAASAGNDLLQAGFSWLTARANEQAAAAEERERVVAHPEEAPRRVA